MQYSKELKNKAQAIVQNTIQGWSQCQTLCECLQDRMEIEFKYSKQLEKLATKLASVNEFFSASFGIRSQLALQIGQQIKDEIECIKEMINSQKAKPHLEYVKLWDNQLQSIKSDLKTVEANLKAKKRDYEIEGTLDLVFQICQPEKAEKQRNKAQNCKFQYEEAIQAYQELKKEFDIVWEEKEAEISLDLVQKQNLDRLNSVKDCMLKIFVYESSIAQNHMYDCEKMSNRLHEQDQAQFIEQFIIKTRQAESQMTEFSSFIIKMMNDYQQYQVKATEMYKLNLDKNEKELQVEIKEIQQSQQLQEEFLNLLSNKFTNRNFQLQINEFIQITSIYIAILDTCLETKNAIFASQLLQFSFGLYAKDQQIRYLQDMLINHLIWQKRDFWESVIIYQITKIKKGEKDKINTTILSILTQVQQQMLMFKLSPDLVKDIVQKFCQFFKLNKDIAQDLILAINSQL